MEYRKFLMRMAKSSLKKDRLRGFNSHRKVSKGGTKIVDSVDMCLAIVEMSNGISRLESRLNGLANSKADKVWRANI